MKRSLRFVSAVFAVALLGALLPGTLQAATFEPLGVTCGPAIGTGFCVVDMSGDGNTILYRDRIWRAGSGFEMIGGPPGGYLVMALSDDGETVVGDVWVEDSPLGPHLEAGIWLGGDQWLALGGLPGTTPCDIYYTSGFDVATTPNGPKVVGLAWVGQFCAGGARAFEWTEQTGMVDLGSIVPDRSSRVNAISADGNVYVGWSDGEFGNRLGAAWNHGAPPEWFAAGEQDIYAGEAIGVSSDGSIVVGGDYEVGTNIGAPGVPYYEPWLWSEATGLIHLGVVKGLRGAVLGGQHYAKDVSDDGKVVVGQDTIFELSEQWAFIWTPDSGIKMLQDYLRAQTDPATKAKICTAQRSKLQPCSGWDFYNTAAVSNDGKIIVGTGKNPQGLTEAFKITLP